MDVRAVLAGVGGLEGGAAAIYVAVRAKSMKAWNAVSTEIPETRKSIERRVRELLGVTSPTQ